MKRRTRDFWAAMGFLLPNLSGFLIFLAGPIIASFVLAFTNWNVMKTVPLRFVWFDNFRAIWESSDFWNYLVNTGYLMIGMPFSIAGSLCLALLLNRKIRGVVAYRTMFYLPQFTAGVALMILWKALYNPDFGMINQLLGRIAAFFGCDDFAGPEWLMSTRNLLALAVERVGFSPEQFGVGAREALIVMGIWTAIGGSNMLLYIAALANIPPELGEAAEIDGATPWAKFRHITWPQLAPTTFFIVVMSFIGGLQGGFDQARVMTMGGPAGTTTTLTYYIYTKAFEEYRVGYASAVSWLLFVIIFAVTLVNWKFGSRRMEDV